MTTDRRVTYRRHHSYATRSNVVRKLRTPGGKVTVQYVTKKANPVKCGDTGVPLQGVS
jgi:large subunit ribosomal protein L34e